MEAPKLEITSSITVDMDEICRWGKFMAIVGFVFTALLAITAILLGVNVTATSIPGVQSMVIAAFYLAGAVFYFWPTLYLYRFSIQLRKAIVYGDQENLSASFQNLKRIFVFFGVLTAITLIFYVLAIIAIGAGGVIGNTMSA